MIFQQIKKGKMLLSYSYNFDKSFGQARNLTLHVIKDLQILPNGHFFEIQGISD